VHLLHEVCGDQAGNSQKFPYEPGSSLLSLIYHSILDHPYYTH
jgi:hypothetical protein